MEYHQRLYERVKINTRHHELICRTESESESDSVQSTVKGIRRKIAVVEIYISMGAFHYAKISGKFCRNMTGTVCFRWSFFRKGRSGTDLGRWSSLTCPSDQKLSFHFQKRSVFSATLLRDNQKFRREEMESFSPDGNFVSIEQCCFISLV